MVIYCKLDKVLFCSVRVLYCSVSVVVLYSLHVQCVKYTTNCRQQLSLVALIINRATKLTKTHYCSKTIILMIFEYNMHNN